MSLVIGLTGPIGCGKSFVAARLAAAGAYTIDADELAREVTGRGRPTLTPIRARFGDGVFEPDGRLDRAALAAIVFSDPIALHDLEAIVHPAVRSALETRLASRAAKAAPFVVIEAIRLVEGGLATRCDEVWLIACDRPTQRQRLQARGMSAEDAERRIDAQAGLVERLASAATRTLRTDGPREGVEVATDEALRQALERSGPGRGPQPPG